VEGERLNYASVCSGIEAPTVAWEALPNWKAKWFSEIEPFPCAMLQHHYPYVPNLGDMTKIHERTEFNDSAIDVLIGGTPCQSFSVAGLRKGLADPRGNLALVFLGLVDRARPSWVVWENVPGVLSSSGGRDFGAFLGGLAELGYGFAYRVLDAQFFGVPQRRRRVFVVGYLGDWRPAAAVLFERHSLSGDTPPSRKKGERVAPSVTSGPPFSRTGNERVECEALVMAHGQGNAEIRRDGEPSLTCNHEAPIVAFMGGQGSKAGSVGASEYLSPTLKAADSGGNRVPCVAIRTAQTSSNGHGIAEDVAYTLDGVQGQAMAFHGSQDPCVSWNITHPLGRNNGLEVSFVRGSTVRRLTPRECERLQGFSDDYTLIPFRGKPAADGPRYKALGNSMAVPVIRWIGERIEAVDKEANP
jgi:DNA (cytosine-5)-methyltransferase 1